MQKTITIHSVFPSEGQHHRDDKPGFTCLINVDSSDGLLTLEFPEKPARDTSAQLATMLPNGAKE